MKKIAILYIIALAITANAAIYQAYSSTAYTVWSNSEGGPWYSTISTTQSSANNPTPWQKLEGQWVAAGGAARPSTTVWFKHEFYVPGSGPTYKASKALIWIAFDKSSPGDLIDTLKITNPSGATFIFRNITKGDTLHLRDFMNLETPTPGNYVITVTSTGDNTHKINFYSMVDKVQIYDYYFSVNNSGYYLISLPMRFPDGTTLQSLLPPIIGAWVWNPFSSYWDEISTTDLLTGSLGEFVRSRSILVLLSSGCSRMWTGYYVERQRYLDLRCASWSSVLYPMSSVAGNVPFNWTTGQPDDIYNWLVNIAYLYVPGTGYVPDAPPYGDYTISRFEGHLSIMDNSGTPETDNNGHLDLYGLFSLYTTNMPSSVTEEHASDIVFYEDTTNPIIGSYPPSGYDVHGLPLPPIVPGIDLHKNIVIIPDEFPVAISPNPFNSATTIKCCIPKNDYSESVILVIYDRLGKKVYETQKNSDKGFAKFTWNGITQNGEEAPSGVYLYKVICGEYSKTGTICLIR